MSTVKLNFFVQNVTVLVPMGYLLACCFIGLFSMKVSGVYALHNHKQTDSSSLLFSAYLLMRFAVPLVYNFMDMAAASKDCAFFKVLGPMRSVSFLGEGFTRWVFPIALLLMFFMTLFNIYGRMLRCFGLNRYSFDSSGLKEHVDEGKHIVEEFKRERKFDIRKKSK